MFIYPAEVRRLIYTTHTVEGCHRQLRKVLTTKASFPTNEASRQRLDLVNQHSLSKWTRPIFNY